MVSAELPSSGWKLSRSRELETPTDDQLGVSCLVAACVSVERLRCLPCEGVEDRRVSSVGVEGFGEGALVDGEISTKCEKRPRNRAVLGLALIVVGVMQGNVWASAPNAISSMKISESVDRFARNGSF